MEIYYDWNPAFKQYEEIHKIKDNNKENEQYKVIADN
jgi:hypothetical protein